MCTFSENKKHRNGKVRMQINMKLSTIKPPAHWFSAPAATSFMNSIVQSSCISPALTMVATPSGILGLSIADVSLLARMLVDKFVFHLPLYRQY